MVTTAGLDFPGSGPRLPAGRWSDESGTDAKSRTRQTLSLSRHAAGGVSLEANRQGRRVGAIRGQVPPVRPDTVAVRTRRQEGRLSRSG
jgi:hypothetical protein